MTSDATILLDTDVLSMILRGNPVATRHAREYLVAHDRFTFSVVTRYEILRGLKARQATTQQTSFEDFCTVNNVLALTDEVVVRAADVYADLYRRGELIGDADILIAATALVEGCNLATNNERHFTRVADLRIENWLEQSRGGAT